MVWKGCPGLVLWVQEEPEETATEVSMATTQPLPPPSTFRHSHTWEALKGIFVNACNRPNITNTYGSAKDPYNMVNPHTLMYGVHILPIYDASILALIYADTRTQ